MSILRMIRESGPPANRFRLQADSNKSACIILDELSHYSQAEGEMFISINGLLFTPVN
jgi:hypothetical protein